ncbi:hypothetical protein GCM10023083_71680 [Streptomyces phyllanthi]
MTASALTDCESITPADGSASPYIAIRRLLEEDVGNLGSRIDAVGGQPSLRSEANRA